MNFLMLNKKNEQRKLKLKQKTQNRLTHRTKLRIK
jgi:hypothetical protein